MDKSYERAKQHADHSADEESDELEQVQDEVLVLGSMVEKATPRAVDALLLMATQQPHKLERPR